MTCKETVRLICEYLEGKLSPSVAVALRRHVGQCKDCSLVFDAAQRTLEVYFDRDAPSSEHAAKARVA